MQLTEKQARGLAAIVDTFCPGDGEGVPSASALGAHRTLIEFAERNPREPERKQLLQLLGLWDSKLLTALGGGGWKHFSALPQEEREKVLLGWGESRITQKRAAFQALRKATLLMYYMLPGPDGGPSPVWDAIDYPGPLGRKEDAPPKPLTPIRIERDESFECDVVVVGSGAGGGTAAGVLAAAGLDVVVLETGEYYDDEDFDGGEWSGISRMYSVAPGATPDQSIGLVAGSCLGGGTVINYSTSFRTPDAVRDEWASHGVPAFATEEFGGSLDAVCKRLGVNQEHAKASVRDEKLEAGARALGWSVDAMPRNVRGCDMGIDCGRCGLGCRLGAKQSVVKTWLKDASDAGARLVVGVTADRVIVENGAARGVEARSVNGHRVTVRSRAVVAACGAIHTPALLKRSGLQNENVGRHLKLHPVTVVMGIFDEEIRPWEGGMQTRYVDEHRDLDDGYGVIYETGPLNPHLITPFTPWRGGRHHLELMQSLSHLNGVAAILRDRDGGEVRVGRDGQPVPRYKLSPFDLKHVRRGIDGAAELLEAAGAKRIFSSHTEWVGYEPGMKGSREQFMADADAAGYGAGQCQFGSFHIMGSARMGGSPATAACRPTGETWDVRDLVVCDASCFPAASGVNPMISIEAIAHMNARGLAERLGASATPAEAAAA